MRALRGDMPYCDFIRARPELIKTVRLPSQGGHPERVREREAWVAARIRNAKILANCDDHWIRKWPKASASVQPIEGANIGQIFPELAVLAQ